jgi:hypothetical protein
MGEAGKISGNTPVVNKDNKEHFKIFTMRCVLHVVAICDCEVGQVVGGISPDALGRANSERRAFSQL